MQLTQVVGNWEDVKSAKPLSPFSDIIIDFFDDLSKKLVTVRDYPDVSTFGFWCRKASLKKERAKYDDLELRLGKGILFHSTPSNVAVNFAFSFAVGLLAGNANIVRLPAKEFEQVKIICAAIDELIQEKYRDLAPYVSMLTYPPDRELHDLFSSLADVRVIWGGDATISELRQSPLKARATEITFADRHSIAVIDADQYLQAVNKNKIARDFYNDTYYTDQNACTAPRIVFWIGENKEEAKKVFWEHLYSLVREKYTLAPAQAVGKLAAFYRLAAERDVRMVALSDSYVSEIKVNYMDDDLMRFKYNSGFFLEHDIDNLYEMVPVCDNRCQTLTYYGVSREDLALFIANSRPWGIDRAVPMGKSMDFTLVWDGYDLIRSLSRRITVI
jgi:hypothetical protein